MNELNSAGIHSGQYQSNFSEAETNQFTSEFKALTQDFAKAMTQGEDPAGATVQELTRQHYAFVSKFWTPNKETYKSLAMSYILPSPYKDTYEAVAKGLGKYHYDAIVIWADKNL